jgi:hypothetical protein
MKALLVLKLEDKFEKLETQLSIEGSNSSDDVFKKRKRKLNKNSQPVSRSSNKNSNVHQVLSSKNMTKSSHK